MSSHYRYYQVQSSCSRRMNAVRRTRMETWQESRFPTIVSQFSDARGPNLSASTSSDLPHVDSTSPRASRFLRATSCPIFPAVVRQSLNTDKLSMGYRGHKTIVVKCTINTIVLFVLRSCDAMRAARSSPALCKHAARSLRHPYIAALVVCQYVPTGPVGEA